MARAKSFGIEFEFIAPSEAARYAPILRTDDLAGAVWIPGDGKANPDRPHAIARERRAHARRDARRGRQGDGRDLVDRRVAGVAGSADDGARSRARRSSTAPGQWARGVRPDGRRQRAAYPAEHFYIVTEPIDGVTPDLPVMRDPTAASTTRRRSAAS